MMEQIRGIKKTKELYMVLAVMCKNNDGINMVGKSEILSEFLVQELAPIEVKNCWNKGAAFIMAMEKAANVCKREL